MFSTEQRVYAAGLGLTLVSFLVSVSVYPEIPVQMATHWNAAGAVDGTMSRDIGLFVVPVIAALVLALFAAIPRIDPLADNIATFRNYYDGFMLLTLGFLLYIHLLVVAYNMGYRFGMARMLSPAMAVLYLGVGLLLRHAQRNWFVGIRTPWTMSDPRVWDRTHKVAARLFLAAAPLALLGTVLPQYTELLIAGPAALAALVATVYSYWLYRQIGG